MTAPSYIRVAVRRRLWPNSWGEDVFSFKDLTARGLRTDLKCPSLHKKKTILSETNPPKDKIMDTLNPPPNPPELDVRAFAPIVFLGIIGAALIKWLEDTWKNAEEKHRRSELWQAYRHRKAWKKSDIAPLNSLGVNEVARRRMARLTGRGRPIVKPHEPLSLAVVTRVSGWVPLVKPDATPSERRQAIKLWP